MADLSKYFGGLTGKAAKALSGHAERMEREQEKAAGASYGPNTNGNSSRGAGKRMKKRKSY